MRWLAIDLGWTPGTPTSSSSGIILRAVGGAGQARLREALVLAVEAGGLGSPGVGTIGVDDGEVSLSKLQRQIARFRDWRQP